MAEITVDSIGSRVVDAIPGFFNDAIDQLRQGEGAYLRDGMPEGVVAQIGQAVGRSACRQFAASPGSLEAGAATRFETACRPYLESIDPNNGAEIDQQSTGGQCAGVPYGARYTYISSPGANPQNYTPAAGQFLPFNTTLFGPITYLGLVSGSPDICGPGGEAYIVQGFTSGGAPLRRALNRGGVACAFPNAGDEIQGLSFERLTAGSECGNQPPTVRQPRPRPDPTPPPFRFNPGPGVNVDIAVDISPDGKITFDIGGGPETVDPFSEGGEAAGGAPLVPGAPGGSSDSGGGGESSGEAGDGEELVGVLVEVLSAPQGANRFDNNSAQPFRGIGYVRLGYPGRLGVDISGGTVISPQFFHAQQRGLTAWAVRANVGFNLRTTPYYRETTS